jgi:polyisoprenoid-binding protein YceI
VRALLLLILLLVPGAAPAQGTYVLDRSSSQVTFRADALANRLVGRSRHLRGIVRLNGFDLRRMYGTVSFPVSSLRMDSRAQEKELARLLGAPVEQDVIFEIDSIASDSTQAERYRFFGRLTMRGISRPVRFGGTAGVTDGRVHADGSATVDVRDWGISPPSRFFGLVRMSPRVRLSFRAEFARREELASQGVAEARLAACEVAPRAC